jgi:signal transduction histidine kinase
LKSIFETQARIEGTTLEIRTLKDFILREHAYTSDLIKMMPKKVTEEPLPKYLRGDCTRLTQVLINLVKNALKFSRGGSVQVFSAYEKATNQLNVVVFDSGKGIKAAEMKNLLTRFSELDRNENLNSDRMGLGLVISKRLVEVNGGKIEIESKGENMGTTVRFGMNMQLLSASEYGDTEDIGINQFENDNNKVNSSSILPPRTNLAVPTISSFKSSQIV